MRPQLDRLRSRWLLAALCLLLAADLGLLALRLSPSPINAASLDRIRPGMTRAEVEALLGGPPGDYRRRGAVYDALAVVVPDGQPEADKYTSEGTEEWLGDRMLIAVRFDRGDRVELAYGVLPDPPAWYRALRRWLPFLD